MLLKKGASLLEYGMLICIAVSAILIMQSFVKRGIQGGLKDSADKIGDQYSVSSSQSYEMRRLTDNQLVREETGTNATSTATLGGILTRRGYNSQATNIVGTDDRGAFTFSDRSGNTSMVAMTKTDSLRNETYHYSNYTSAGFSEFQMNNTPAW